VPIMGGGALTVVTTVSGYRKDGSWSLMASDGIRGSLFFESGA
jgi:hypothetical protein